MATVTGSRSRTARSWATMMLATVRSTGTAMTVGTRATIWSARMKVTMALERGLLSVLARALVTMLTMVPALLTGWAMFATESAEHSARRTETAVHATEATEPAAESEAAELTATATPPSTKTTVLTVVMMSPAADSMMMVTGLATFEPTESMMALATEATAVRLRPAMLAE